MLYNDCSLSLPPVVIHLDPSLIETDEEEGGGGGGRTSSVNKADFQQMPVEAVLHKLWKRVKPEDYLTIPGIYSAVV